MTIYFETTTNQSLQVKVIFARPRSTKLLIYASSNSGSRYNGGSKKLENPLENGNEPFPSEQKGTGYVRNDVVTELSARMSRKSN